MPHFDCQGFFQNIGCWLANNWPRLFAAGIILAGSLVAIWLLRKVLFSLCVRWHNGKKKPLVARLCKNVIRPLTWFGILCGIRVALAVLPINHSPTRLWIERIFICGIALLLAVGLNILLNTFCRWLIAHETKSQKSQQVLLTDLIRRCMMALLWFLTFFFLLQNVCSLNVSALLAGAGVIGLALAFAAQNTVANLFGAVSLIGDAPFKIGDWVKIGDQEGLVEGIGLRSIRLRAFTGELLIIPNRLAADSIISNQTERKFFRQTINVALTYTTSADRIRLAMDILKEILDNRPICNRERPPVIIFNEMKDWSLNICIIIWFTTGDFWLKNQELSVIHTQILERFNAAGLEFAFPTNTTYLIKQD